MAAGVTVTCVIDACHSGAVLELPYSYMPTDGGVIRAQRNMSSLSNLAFLYLLAGGMLPHGFDNVVENIEDVTGGNIEDYQGMGMDDAAQDAGDYVPEDAVDYGDGADYQDTDGYGDTSPDYAGGAPEYDAGARDIAGDDGGPAIQGYDVADGGSGEQVWGGPVGDTDSWNDGDGVDFGRGWGDSGDGGDPDMDCSCFADVLGALLDGE